LPPTQSVAECTVLIVTFSHLDRRTINIFTHSRIRRPASQCTSFVQYHVQYRQHLMATSNRSIKPASQSVSCPSTRDSCVLSYGVCLTSHALQFPTKYPAVSFHKESVCYRVRCESRPAVFVLSVKEDEQGRSDGVGVYRIYTLPKSVPENYFVH